MSDLPLGRLYESDDQLRAVERALTEEGFPKEAIFAFAASGREQQSTDDIADEITERFPKWFPPNHAATYAEKIQLGHGLLLLDVPFGRGALVERILSRHASVAVTLPMAPSRPLGPTPFSDWLGLGTLKHGRTFQAREGSFLCWLYGDSSSRNFLIFDWIPTISDKASPLSSLFGLRTLSQNPDAGDKSFGIALKSDSPSPLSSKLGMRVLSSSSDMGSSSFGIPLKSDNATPFSSFLGLPTLTRPSRRHEGS
jgi:hypothetical protein